MKNPIKTSSFLIVLVLFLSSLTGVASREDEEKARDSKPPLYQVPLPGLKFRTVGPALTSGRISDFAVNPENPSEYYVAVASGGVWKTTNGGVTFEPIFDNEGSYSIGCLAMDPTNHNVIWVGTGENNNQRSVGYGDGLYKSIDGGQSWTKVGLEDSEHIGMIAIDPEDPDTVYVAAYGPLWSAGGDRGLYKTTDGGKTWEAVLVISENTGVSEVHLDPRDSRILYAVAHQRRRHVFTYIGGGPESGLHKSEDGGKTWRKLSTGLPSGHLGRIGIDISPANPDVLYAIVEAVGDKGGFYRSTDRGETWERRSGYFTSGNYYQEIFADPRDVERVYSMDTYGQVTVDGGKTWNRTGEKSKHVDNHALWIDPDNPSYLLAGCDGGIYESYDRGENWRFMPNLPVTQFYKVSTDNSEPFYNIYGGTQDNYSLGGPSRNTSGNGITSEDWFVTKGGDGFETQVDPANPDIIYSQSQYGNLVRFDRRSGERVDIKPREGRGENAYVWNWDAPLLISPHSNTRLYFAADRLFRSDDRGNSWTAVCPDLSRQLDRNKLEVMGQVYGIDTVAKHDATSVYGNIVSLSESPRVEGLLYAGTDDGLIHVTEDQENWVKHEAFPGVPKRSYVDDILASQHRMDTVYAAFNNHKEGDFKPYLLKSTDRGETWTSIASDLPERGSIYSVAEDFIRPDLVFVGTEFGVYFTLDGGLHWRELESGLPTIAVRDIEIQKGENDIVLGTFGRGFYVLDDYSPLRELTNSLIEKEAYLFGVSDGILFLPYSRLGEDGKGFQGETFYRAENPEIGAKISFFYRDDLKSLREVREESEKKAFEEKQPIDYPEYQDLRAEEQQEASFLFLTVLDAEDRLVRVLRAPAKRGLHRLNWDLRFASTVSADPKESDEIEDSESGIMVLPGTYKVHLSKSVDGVATRLTEAVSFQVSTLNNRTIPTADWEALAGFQGELAELNRVLNGTRRAVRELQEKTDYFRAALKSVQPPNREIESEVRKLEDRLKAIGRKLFGDTTAGRLDLDQPPSLSSRINSIVSNGLNSTSDPTRTHRRVFDLVGEELVPIVDEVNEILTSVVPPIEQKLEAAGAPWTPGRKIEWKRR